MLINLSSNMLKLLIMPFTLACLLATLFIEWCRREPDYEYWESYHDGMLDLLPFSLRRIVRQKEEVLIVARKNVSIVLANKQVIFDIEYGTHHMDFKVHIESTDIVDDWETFCNGSIKWDHCMNIDIGEEGVMMHFCEAEDVAIIKAVTDKLYEYAKQIEAWDRR